MPYFAFSLICDRASEIKQKHWDLSSMRFVINAGETMGINPDYLIPVAQEAIPKTAIGKIQRSQMSQCFLAGEFKPILKRIDILLGNANTIPDWFYRQVWKPKYPMTFNSYLTIINATLVFLDSFGLGPYLCQILSEQNLQYITVSPGEDFLQISRSSYTITLGKAKDYRY